MQPKAQEAKRLATLGEQQQDIMAARILVAGFVTLKPKPPLVTMHNDKLMKKGEFHGMTPAEAARKLKPWQKKHYK